MYVGGESTLDFFQGQRILWVCRATTWDTSISYQSTLLIRFIMPIISALLAVLAMQPACRTLTDMLEVCVSFFWLNIVLVPCCGKTNKALPEHVQESLWKMVGESPFLILFGIQPTSWPRRCRLRTDQMANQTTVSNRFTNQAEKIQIDGLFLCRVMRAIFIHIPISCWIPLFLMAFSLSHCAGDLPNNGAYETLPLVQVGRNRPPTKILTSYRGLVPQ